MRRDSSPAVLIVASLASRTSPRLFIPGVTFPADLEDYFMVIFRNGLVLALHAVACVAGFIAGSSLPLQAQHMTGWRRSFTSGPGLWRSRGSSA